MEEAIVLKLGQEKLQEVDALVKTISQAEQQLEHGYAKLASLLNEVADKQYWVGTYDSYGDFLNHIQNTYGLGKSQLYNYRSVAHTLEGTATEEQLNLMGISKALALREAKRNNQNIPDTILTQATDASVSVSDLKKLLFEAHYIEKHEHETWMDLNFSAYVTDEEKAEINDATKAARRVDPPIDEKLPEHMQKKEILLRFAREFLATYSGDADGE